MFEAWLTTMLTFRLLLQRVFGGPFVVDDPKRLEPFFVDSLFV